MLRLRSFLRCATQIRATVDEALKNASQHFKDGDIHQCIKSNLAIFESTISSAILNDGNMWMKVAAARINTAFAYKLLGEFDKSLEQATAGLKLLDAHFSHSKPEICHALDLCAELHIASGKHADAQAYVTRSLDLKNTIYPAESPQLINSHNLQGAIEFAGGRLEAAEASYLKSVSIGLFNFGGDRPLNQQLAVTLSNLAGVWRANRKWSQCVEAYSAVKESFANSFGESSWMTGQANIDLGLSLLSAGSGAAAKEPLVAGLAILVNTSGPGHPSALAAMEGLKEANAASGDSVYKETEFLSEFLKNVKVPEKRKSGITGDFYFLDRRGHVGGGHPFSSIK